MRIAFPVSPSKGITEATGPKIFFARDGARCYQRQRKWLARRKKPFTEFFGAGRRRWRLSLLFLLPRLEVRADNGRIALC